ncbi:unnamed protein product [Calypogeia fissa]
MPLEGSIDEALKLLKNSTVLQIVKNLRRLIEVPFNASVRDTLNTMHAHDILAVVVAAPPGHWIGAGGTSILEADKCTGVVRKHYIGMVSVTDILVHIVEDNAQMNVPISKVIGHSLESLNLWTIGPSTSVYDAVEPMSKGVHRVLVPFESERDVLGVESVEASAGYHILTQTDILQFIQDHAKLLEGFLSLSIADIGAVKRSVYAVPHTMLVMNAFKCMASTLLPAVPIVQADPRLDMESTLINGEGRKLIGTISASDLRGCNSDTLSSCSSMSVLEWAHKVWVSKHFGSGAAMGPEANLWQVKPQVTCRLATPLGEVIALALRNHIHRVWITDDQGSLMGLVALSDILSVFHKA